MADLELWYDAPAREWTEALPIGNGRLGAMIFGGAERERLQLNEDTLWTGGPYSQVNPEARPHLDEVRSLIFAGRYAEAEALAERHLMARPLKQMSYQPAGDLWIDQDIGGDDRRVPQVPRPRNGNRRDRVFEPAGRSSRARRSPVLSTA